MKKTSGSCSGNRATCGNRVKFGRQFAFRLLVTLLGSGVLCALVAGDAHAIKRTKDKKQVTAKKPTKQKLAKVTKKQKVTRKKTEKKQAKRSVAKERAEKKLAEKQQEEKKPWDTR